LVADFGPIAVDTLRPRHIDDWHTTRRAKGYARAYNVRIIGCLGSACAWGLKRDLCETNAVASARQKREVGRKVKNPSAETVKAALDLAKTTDPALYLFVRIDAVTGARRSEILGLTRDDFNSATKQLTIRRRVVPAPGGIAIEDATKSDAGTRTISIGEDTCALIEKRLAEVDSPWIFCGRDRSRPMNPTSISHAVSRLGRRMGFRLHPHALRHYSCTTSLARGVPLPIVAARMGDTIATITKIYSHAVLSDDRGAADAMEDSIT
jgi:integrase